MSVMSIQTSPLIPSFLRKYLQKIQPVHYELIKFIAVGALNTLFAYVIFSLFLYMKLHYTVASFLAIVLGVMFNFKTYGGLVFKRSDNTLIFRFILIYAVLYVISIGGLWCFNHAGVNLYYANAIMLAPMSALSFCLNKFFVFV